MDRKEEGELRTEFVGWYGCHPTSGPSTEWVRSWWLLSQDILTSSLAIHRFNLWIIKIPWRRDWLPTPVFWPGEFHGQRSLAGCIVHGVAKSQTQLSDFHFLAIPSGNVWLWAMPPSAVTFESSLSPWASHGLLFCWTLGALWAVFWDGVHCKMTTEESSLSCFHWMCSLFPAQL